MKRRASISFRQGPPELSGRKVTPQASGSLLSAPMRFRDFARTSPQDAERVFASYAAAKDAAQNAPAVAEDAVIAPARFISATIVPGYWMDHTDPEPLRRAVPLFESLQVQSMHCAMPELWLGCVTDAAWDDTPLGVEQVPGISGHFAIEGKSERAQTVALGVMRRSLKRLSLGFCAEYEASHDEMNAWGCEDYFSRLGTPAPDGSLYRFVVTAVPDVYEVSLVDVGAIESALVTDAPDNRAQMRAPDLKPGRPAPFLALPLRRTESQR